MHTSDTPRKLPVEALALQLYGTRNVFESNATFASLARMDPATMCKFKAVGKRLKETNSVLEAGGGVLEDRQGEGVQTSFFKALFWFLSCLKKHQKDPLK